MDPGSEWLEADGLGGFASGTASGIRTRRYHALLLHARRPPTERLVLVNGFDAQVDTAAGSWAISSQAYLPDVVHPDGAARIASFSSEPWPCWRYALPGGGVLEQELFVPRGAPAVVVRWRLLASSGGGPTTLRVRPFLSGRDYHALHHENAVASLAPEEIGDRLRWRLYPDVPAVTMRANGRYVHAPDWYRRFRYDEERARGLDDGEDLAAPGELHFDLGAGEAAWLLAAEGHEPTLGDAGEPAPFATRFWHEAGGHLYDVVDVEHRAGAVDPSFRANQILAVGGLPFPLLEGPRARRLVDVVEERLLTPLGLRSLAPGEPGYRPRNAGGVAERDGAYHQGTVWPWLLGPFVEAWVRVRGDTPAVRRAARERFLPPLHAHLAQAGLGHVSEIADAERPHTPRGCPFQAWSLGELLRLEHRVLAEPGGADPRA